MYAVFEDGSRQFRVQEGDVVKVDFREATVGAPLEFGRVLLYQSDTDTQIGQPVVEGARVLAEVVDHPTTKLYIQHFRRRKNYRRLKGHRQPYTSVRINHILLAGMQPQPKAPPPAPSEEPTSEAPAQMPAPEMPAATEAGTPAGN